MFFYLYRRTADSIHQLKTEAYKATTEEKLAYRSPDGKSFRTNRPPQYLIDAGWVYSRVKFQRVESHMSPQHERWPEYRNAKRRATLLLAARLILKANDGVVPAKEEISPLISMRLFRSHARTASVQKALAHSAYRYLRKLDNRLRKQPQRFADVSAWLAEREVPDVGAEGG